MKNEKKKSALSSRQKAAIIINFVILLIIYYGCIYFGEKTMNPLPYQICSGVYVSAAIILGALSLLLSGKIVSEKKGEERTDKQISMSKTLLLWVLPLFVVLLIDFMDLFVVEYIKQMLSSAK